MKMKRRIKYNLRVFWQNVGVQAHPGRDTLYVKTHWPVTLLHESVVQLLLSLQFLGRSSQPRHTLSGQMGTLL